MAGPLVVCAACSSHVLTSDRGCPHCGASVHDGKGNLLGRTASAVLMGLALAGCPAEDDSGDSMGGDGSSSTAATTAGTSSGPGSTSMGGTSVGSTTLASSTDDSGSVGTSFDTQSAYGVPDTDSFGSTTDSSSSGGDTDTDTDADPGMTTGAPLYGAAPSDE